MGSLSPPFPTTASILAVEFLSTQHALNPGGFHVPSPSPDLLSDPASYFFKHPKSPIMMVVGIVTVSDTLGFPR
jgi:hypothetical protein